MEHPHAILIKEFMTKDPIVHGSREAMASAYTPRETSSGWYYDKEGLNLLKLEHFMTKEPLTLTPENTLKEAAEIMARTKFGCLPIVAAGTRKLVGIVSYVDILKEIVKHF